MRARIAAALVLLSMWSSPAAAVDLVESCRSFDGTVVSRMRPLLERTDFNTTAVVHTAMNHLAAARRHCQAGHAARAQELYAYLERALDQFEAWELARAR